MGLFDKIKNAARQGVDAANNAAKNAQEAADRAADEARKAADKAADAARGAAGSAGNAAGGASGSAGRAGGVVARHHTGAESPNLGFLPRERLLTQAEIDIAKTVFRDTLPYGAIYLSNQTGAGDAPYAIPHPTHLGSYVLHVGATAFGDASTGGSAMLLIHELTHVWQSTYYGLTSFDYICDSLASQAGGLVSAGDRTVAYGYTPGGEWDSYNVEQQANIVQDWFNPKLGKRSESHELFRYIRDNIRQPKRRPGL